MLLTTAKEMQAMDRAAIESFGLPGRVLMENAGRGAVQVLVDHFENIGARRIAVVAGRGNNGGDGFVIARYLFQKGMDVRVYLLSSTDRLSGNAAENLQLLTRLKVPVVEVPDPPAFDKHRSQLSTVDIWIDAMLGTGLNADVKGFYKTLIDFINASGKPVMAVDIASGLNADTGHPCGAAVRAQVTATFAFAKRGQVVYPGSSYTGRLEVVDIGIPPFIADQTAPAGRLLTIDHIRRRMPERGMNAHKGDTGHLLAVAGSAGKTGAAVMTAMSAMRIGCGLVTLAVSRQLNSVLEVQAVEAMTAVLPDGPDGVLSMDALPALRRVMHKKSCLALGPGLGTAVETRDVVMQVLQESRLPVVLDADGLNIVAANPSALASLSVETVLTPHPGEMARLMATSTAAVQQDRIGCACEAARAYNAHVVLKGAGTIVAHPDGRFFVNPTGNPGMASGGMGDVLTGVIAGFIAQGVPPGRAARIGVYLHGAAADHLADGMGPRGYLATDVMAALPRQIQDLQRGHA